MATDPKTLEKMKCRCGCGEYIENATVVNAWRVLKKVYPEMDCTSWYRCKKHNDSDAVKGAPNSKHMTGEAIDLTFSSGLMLAELIHMGRMLGMVRAFIYPKKHIVHLDCHGRSPHIGVME